MIGCICASGILSAAFFLVWQYDDHPWWILLYVTALLAVCAFYGRMERRHTRRMLARFEKILTSGSADYVADEDLTPTERKLLTRLCALEAREAGVQDSYRRISSLVADIAHQSKTPLSALLMHTELQGGGAVLRTQTEKLRFLMESLTKLAKCEGGLIAENLSPKGNSVRELVRLAVEGVYDAAAAKSMEIHCAMAEVPAAVFDLRWTCEAVGNLLDNAVKYAPAGSTIRISAYAYELFVRLDIADEGPGIPEDELCHIWKRFYRGKNAECQSGVGIGLYLTESILHAQGGRCAVKSTEDGSTFSVFLPKL